jgi:hypothetical protein
MMVMWSKHTGADDPDGIGVVEYMAATMVKKPRPEGGREWIHRVPPPEVLKGDEALMRQTIRAVPFQCRYSSGVLSFEQGDMDVSKFNAGDPELRRRVAEVIREFEDTAYAGIAEEHRPPTFWTTHTHTRRLELNYCMPRAILAGDGRLRSINPHPPGRESIKLFDAFRDVFNARYGWADPEDPARARLTKVPNWAQKIAAEAARAGNEGKKSLVEEIGKSVEAAFAAGEISNRDDLIAQLKAGGNEVARAGRDYITLVNESGVRVRLRGWLFSEAFTSPEAIALRADAPSRLFLPECEERLGERRERRARFHRSRYGGPEWEPPEVTTGPNTPPPLEHLIDQDAPPSLHAKSLGHRPPAAWPKAKPFRPGGQGEIEPDEPREAARRNYKAKLFILIFGATLSEDLLMALRWIDRDSRTVRLVDGSAVMDHGDRISATNATELAVKLMIAEAQAKGWERIKVNGTPEFQRLAVAMAVRAGLDVGNPELAHLVARERSIMKESEDGRLDPDGARVAASSQPPSGSSDGGTGARGTAERASRQLGLALDGCQRAVGQLKQHVRDVGKASHRGVIRVRRQREDEIERFKAEVDLCAVAATLGFAEDRRAGDRNHRVMRHQDGTKLIIGASKAGHWVYSSNCGQAGTVVDLLGWRHGLNLGEIRKHLRPWIGEEAGRPKVDIQLYAPKPKPVPAPADVMKAVAEWESANITMRSIFLERSRGLDPATLANDRFAGTFRVDQRQNAVFPYRNGYGSLIGTERRNRPPKGSKDSFKHYSGAVGIWMSNASPSDTRLVITESPIDAMSHWEMLSPQDRAATRYAVIRSGCADEDLEAVVRAMPVGAVVISACDPNEAGNAYTTKIMAVAAGCGRESRDERPAKGDWNDLLREQQPLRQVLGRGAKLIDKKPTEHRQEPWAGIFKCLRLKTQKLK